VISVNDEIRISASTKIELVAGQSSITLDGGDIEFKTPGAFTVKGSGHAFLGGGDGAAELARLPDSTVKLFDEAFIVKNKVTGEPIANVCYRIRHPSGEYEYGMTDDRGATHLVCTSAPTPITIEVESA
jgi:type VI secretion system secreted protein VgrG